MLYSGDIFFEKLRYHHALEQELDIWQWAGLCVTGMAEAISVYESLPKPGHVIGPGGEVDHLAQAQ